MIRFPATALACCALWAALPSSAQTPATGTAASAARPDPQDARSAVPAAVHTPALRQYRRLADEPRLAWREANEQVDRIGGWRAYAREAAAAAKPAAAPSAPATASPAPAAAPAHKHHHQP